MVDAAGTTAYTYTSGGFLYTEDGPFANDTVTNLYSNRLRVGLGLQQPTGDWTNGFTYDAAKRLTSVTSLAGTFNYTYDSSRLGLVVNVGLPNTSFITNIYDPMARLLTTLLKTSGGTTLDAAEYGYNTGNQRTTFTNAAGTHVSYTYDNISQLTVASSSVSTENRGYYYDAAWNLNRQTNNGTTTTFTVNNRNELTTAGVLDYSYDTNGNVINRLATSGTNIDLAYGYDDENRLTSLQVNVTGTPTSLTTFVYDGLGRLREQLQWTNNGSGGTRPLTPGGSWGESGGTLYVYDGKRVIQERDINNNPTVRYTRGKDLSGSLEGAGGIGGLLARTDGSGSTFYHADGNGNITYLVNTNQTLAASYRYDPFGNLISSSGTLATANTYRFSSKEYIPSVGIYYYLYRFYDPGAQRWINRDPIGEIGDENLYAALKNEPLSTVDALGLDPGPGIYNPTPDPVFDPTKWQNENCLAYGLNRPCNAQMLPFPKGKPQGEYDSCDDLKKGLKDNYGALDPIRGKCPLGWHKIRLYPGFHVQRQDGDGKWSEKEFGFGARRCKTDSAGEPIDSPQDPDTKTRKACKGDLCVPN